MEPKKVVYNSETNERLYTQLASGYVSETVIVFEKENICALVNASGKVDFQDARGKLLASASAPAVTDGKEKYVSLYYRIDENKIILDFPVYEWIDNYPHCDGEHDRWDTREIGAHTITFDCINHKVL